MPPALTIAPDAWKQFRDICEKAYPNEGCGLLIGRLADQSPEKKLVQKVVPLENMLLKEGRGRFDFAFSPEEFMQAQQAAEKEQLDVVGLYHTHPDHPPRPSATDASQPMLAGWINVIASVHGGKFKEAKAWYREDEKQPFVESRFVVIGT